MSKPSKNIDMTIGSVWQQLIAFAVPVMLGELFQQSYSIIDSAIVGNYVGADALAAVGSSESITKILVGFFNGVSLGCTVVVARCFGERNNEKMRRTVHTIVYMSLALGLLLSVTGVLITEWALKMMGTQANILPMSRRYLKIYFAGMSGMILYNTISGILRAVGDSKRPLYFLIFSSLLNIVLDILLISVFKMGVAGAALATIVSQGISAVMCLILLLKTDAPWRFSFAGRLDGQAASAVFKNGIPVGLQKMITSLSNIIVLSYINYFESDCMAGWVVYIKVSHVLIVVAQSLSSATTTFISQNLGARQYKRAREGVRYALPISLAVVGLLLIPVYIFHDPIIRIFGSESGMMYYSELFLFNLVIFQLFHVFMGVYMAAMRGMGKAGVGTLCGIAGMVVYRQIYLMSATKIANTPIVVGASHPMGWVVAGTLLCIYYYWFIKNRLPAEDDPVKGGCDALSN